MLNTVNSDNKNYFWRDKSLFFRHNIAEYGHLLSWKGSMDCGHITLTDSSNIPPRKGSEDLTPYLDWVLTPAIFDRKHDQLGEECVPGPEQVGQVDT